MWTFFCSGTAPGYRIHVGGQLYLKTYVITPELTRLTLGLRSCDILKCFKWNLPMPKEFEQVAKTEITCY